MSEPSLDEVLSDDFELEELQESGEVQEAIEVEVAAEPESKEEPPSSEPQENRIDPEQFKGYLDEREKRQKLEAEIEQLRKQQPQREPEQRIDPVDDPQGFQDQIDARIRQATFEQDLKWMKRTHDDWDQAETWINEQLNTNVAMQAKLSNSDNLLEDSYKMYQDHLKLEQLSDVDSLRAQIREELKQELMGEVSQESEEKVKQEEAKAAAVMKPSLAETGNSTGSVATEGLMSLDDLMGRDFNKRP